MRPKHNFAYITGTNRNEDLPIIKGMLNRAKEVGVAEDFHVFAPLPVSDCTYHHWTGQWRDHMAKSDMIKELANSTYDYVVWLDADTWFQRDPGDLSDLIRDEKCWVSMESDLRSPEAKHNEWHGVFIKPMAAPPLPLDKISPLAPDLFESFGAKHAFNTNGGMFIVRREFIEEFHEIMNGIYHHLRSMGWQRIVDEVPLAIVGAMVSDPLQNTFEKHKHRWAIDCHNVFYNRLPDGNPWSMKDWLTQADRGQVNPDIVHVMRSKHLLRNYGYVAEPVGTKMAEIIAEAGIQQPAGCSCKTMQAQCDTWGIDGCRAHRKEILHHLAEASDNASWLDFAKMASRGIFSCGALLDKAIERASAV